MRSSGTPRAVLALTAALIAAALPAGSAMAAPAPALPTAATRTAPLILPQQNVPQLDAPGEPKAVTFPPDNRARRGPGAFTVTAPPYTRITQVDSPCLSRNRCSLVIAADGATATVRMRPGRWTFSSPVQVHLQAESDAPLQRAEYSGTFNVDGEEQPLKAVITEGVQGGLGLKSKDAPNGSGATVAATTPGGAADNAGIREGDVITSLNNTPVRNASELRDARLGKLRSGATVPVTYRQPNGTTRTVETTLD
ncbi:PDZ domain-containing protein [Streptomyces sp. NPDC091377]|uniref:PDZ domain-containing protein n=1 Tax=unclassified Streptomyces TaxID=2593676 RepID=UPI003807031B